VALICFGDHIGAKARRHIAHFGFESPRERQSFQLLREKARKANRALPIFCLLSHPEYFMTETCDEVRVGKPRATDTIWGSGVGIASGAPSSSMT
jgi:hypothetical protein